MNFNNWDDNEDEFNGDDGNHRNSYFDRLRDREKEMLKINMVRHLEFPPSLEEWREFFGEPTDEDLADITQAYLKQYIHYGDKHIAQFVDAFDINWVQYLLSYNESVEEYELCAIIKSHIDANTKSHKQNIGERRKN